MGCLKVKKLFLVGSCLILALILMPGGMASWMGYLSIDGKVTTGELEADISPGEGLEQNQSIYVNNEQDDIYQENKLETEKDLLPEPIIKKCDLTVLINGKGNTTPVSGIHRYKEGTEVKLKAIPEDGWKFVQWVINTDIYDNPTIFLFIDKDINVKAEFQEIEKNLDQPIYKDGDEKVSIDNGKHGDNYPQSNGDDREGQ